MNAIEQEQREIDAALPTSLLPGESRLLVDTNYTTEAARHADRLYANVGYLWFLLPTLCALPGLIPWIVLPDTIASTGPILMGFVASIFGAGIGCVVASILVNFFRLFAVRSIKH
jgi:hypothetical protein